MLNGGGLRGRHRLTAQAVQAPGAGAGGHQIEEDEAEQDGRLAAVQEGVETRRGVEHEIGYSHYAGQDAVVDLVGDGFDCALRIAALPDSSLMARKQRPIRRRLVAAPNYLAQRGRPTHPHDLTRHACLGYVHLPSPEIWRFIGPGKEEVSIRAAGPLRANNADALTASLCAGLGLAVQPDFITWKDVMDGWLEPVMTDWSLPPISLHLVTPGGGSWRPALSRWFNSISKRGVQ